MRWGTHGNAHTVKTVQNAEQQDEQALLMIKCLETNSGVWRFPDVRKMITGCREGEPKEFGMFMGCSWT